MNYKVTAIIPVYNTANFIEKCACSLFNQTLSEVEYIFVDDYSTDESFSILKNVTINYPDRQNDIRLIHNTENLGPAISRDRALDIASGEFIIVIDSDDYIDKEMFESMYHIAIEANADVVVSDMLIEFHNKTIYFADYVPNNKSEYFTEMLTNIKSSPSLCNKLINRSLYLNTQCRNRAKAKYMEDRNVCTKIYFFATKIIKTNKPYYHYVKHNTNSTTSSYSSEHFESLLEFWENTDSFLSKNNVSAKYNEIVLHSKLKDKLKLMMYVDSYCQRKKYASIFPDTVIINSNELKIGEKLMRFLIRKKMYIFTTYLQKLIKLKSRIL